jgi:hypothetical protein
MTSPTEGYWFGRKIVNIVVKNICIILG